MEVPFIVTNVSQLEATTMWWDDDTLLKEMMGDGTYAVGEARQGSIDANRRQTYAIDSAAPHPPATHAVPAIPASQTRRSRRGSCSTTKRAPLRLRTLTRTGGRPPTLPTYPSLSG